MLMAHPNYAVIDALARLGDRRAVEPLLGLVDHSDLVIRYNVYEALGLLGDARALPALRRAAAEDRDWADYGARNADGDDYTYICVDGMPAAQPRGSGDMATPFRHSAPVSCPTRPSVTRQT
jgi:HEAT repeat protein